MVAISTENKQYSNDVERDVKLHLQRPRIRITFGTKNDPETKTKTGPIPWSWSSLRWISIPAACALLSWEGFAVLAVSTSFGLSALYFKTSVFNFLWDQGFLSAQFTGQIFIIIILFINVSVHSISVPLVSESWSIFHLYPPLRTSRNLISVVF